MKRCRYITETGRWACPFQAIPGDKYCYWHKEEDGKKPKESKFRELREAGKPLYNAYLRKANLVGLELECNLHEPHILLLSADIQEANISNAVLCDITIQESDLRGSSFRHSKLENVSLSESKITGADFDGTTFRKVNLNNSDLRSVNFSNSILTRVDLTNADLTGANLFGTYVDKDTNFMFVNLALANLYHSYIDETKSLRNANIFDSVKKDINELVGDYLFHRDIAILDIQRIEGIGEKGKEICKQLFKKGLVRYVLDGHPIVFYDLKRGKFLSFPEENQKISDSRSDDNMSKLEEDTFNLVRGNYESIRYSENRKKLYMAAYEVYNSLYSYYVNNGKLDEAFYVHYRRNEVKRKMLIEEGGSSKIRAYLFDYILLKLLTGYGVKLERPFIALAVSVLLYSFFFEITNSILKIVDGKIMHPTFWDYLYYSIITFAGIGASNFYPNPNAEKAFYILASTESLLGIFILSLIIFVVTYRVSR